MKNFLTSLSLFLSIAAIKAQTPTPISNIIPNSGSICGDHHYTSDYFVQMKNGKIFFPVCNNVNDAFPYITDGTAAGTTWLNIPNLVLNNGTSNKQFQCYEPQSDKIYFSGADPSFSQPDIELWATDGTITGTKKVKEIAAGTASAGPEYLTAHKGKVYFSCKVGTAMGFWVTDGTDAGTIKLKSLTTLVKNIKSYGDKLYFMVQQSSGSFDYDLWESDGTAAGTKKVFTPTLSEGTVQDFRQTPLGFYVITRAFSNNELNMLNLTAKTLTKIYNGSAGDANLPIHFKGKDYFLAKYWSGTQDFYVTDGTSAGTSSLMSGKFKTPTKLLGNTILAGESFLAFTGSTTAEGQELWVSDGTKAGTKLIDLNKGTADAFPGNLCRVGNTIYFAADVTDATGKAIGRELMQTDGTVAGTKLVADIFTGTSSSNPELIQLLNLGGKPNLIFFADNGAGSTGQEPYKLEVKPITDTKDTDLMTDLISIAPNPTQNELHISIKEGENTTIAIFDMNGKQIKYFNNVTTSIDIDTYSLQNGLYLLKAQTTNGAYQIHKFVKK